MDAILTDKIFVSIADIECPEEWVYSDTIYVIGDISLKHLEARLWSLSFNDIQKSWYYGEPVNVDLYDRTKNIYMIYWD